jgi:hypothetical protein
MNEGPFQTAVEAQKTGVIKEEYIVYRMRDGMFVRETSVRNHLSNNDYNDTSTVEPLVEMS